MKLLLLTLLIGATAAFGAGWDDVQRIPAGGKIEVSTRDGTRARGVFVSATADALVIREKLGERSVRQADIRRVSVANPSRRAGNGLLWTAVGATAGAVAGWAVCPHCANEGSPGKFVGPGVAIGAGLGALSFLSMPYRTVFKSK